MPSPINRQINSFDQYSRPAPGADMTSMTRFNEQGGQMAQQFARNQANDNLPLGYTYNSNGSMFPQGMPQLNPSEPTSRGANGRNSYGDYGQGLDNTRKVLGQDYNPKYLSPLSGGGAPNPSANIQWSQSQPSGGQPNPQDNPWSIMNQSKMASGEINNPVLEAAGLQKAQAQSGQSGQPDQAIMQAMQRMLGLQVPDQKQIGNYNTAKDQMDIVNGKTLDPTMARANGQSPTNYNEPNPQSFGSWWTNNQQGQQAPNGNLRDKLSQEQVKANQNSGYGVNSTSNPNVTYEPAKPVYRPMPTPEPLQPAMPQDSIDRANRNLGTTSPAATPMTRITGRDRNGPSAFSSKKPGAMGPYGSGW